MSGFRPLEAAVPALRRLGTEAVDNEIASLASADIRSTFGPGDAIEENAQSGNSLYLSPGAHEGFRLSKAHTTITGSAGTIVNRLATIGNHALVMGLHFKQESDASNVDHLVRVSGGRVLFEGCVFERKYDAPYENSPTTERAFVVIDKGARAIFTNCVFRSNRTDGVMNGLGIVVQNLNPIAGDVFVVAVSNFTTHNWGATVTVTGPEI